MSPGWSLIGSSVGRDALGHYQITECIFPKCYSQATGLASQGQQEPAHHLQRCTECLLSPLGDE